MSGKTVTLRRERLCSQCNEPIKAKEQAIYVRYSVYSKGHEGEPMRVIDRCSCWFHPHEMICHVEEPQRSKCIAGEHDLHAEEEYEPFRGYWDPPTLTGRMICVCGYSPEDKEDS